jgi:hypothetical protein
VSHIDLVPGVEDEKHAPNREVKYLAFLERHRDPRAAQAQQAPRRWGMNPLLWSTLVVKRQVQDLTRIVSQVELRGLEPLTPCLQSRCSSS